MSSIFSRLEAFEAAVFPVGSLVMRLCARAHLVSLGMGSDEDGVASRFVGDWLGCPSGYIMTLEEASMSFRFFWPTSMWTHVPVAFWDLRFASSRRMEIGIVGLLSLR